MKPLKSIMIVLLMAALLLCCLAILPHPKAAAATVASGTCGDNLTWTLDDAGKLTISGTGPMDDYIYTEGEWGDVSIDLPWYDYLSSIQTVVIENGVTYIGDYAFWCSKATAVTIPASVTAIGESSFYGCIDLTSIAIPKSVKSIGDYAFYWTGLNTVTIPGSVQSIGCSSFSECDSLYSVGIEEGVVSIGRRAFYSNSSLQVVVLPESVKSIGEQAFSGCTVLKTVTYRGTSAQWNTVSKGSNWDSQSGSYTLTCQGDTPSQGLKYTLSSDSTYYIVTNGTCTDSYVRVPGTYKGLPVKELGANAFSGRTGITRINLPNSIVTVGANAFARCTGLTNLTLPGSVTTIGSGAFSGCTGFTDLSLPSSVTTIGSSAFSDCTGFTSFTVPENVHSLGEEVFANCTGLTSVTLPTGVTSISNGLFLGCTGLTSYTVPDSITAIGSSAFQGCTGLTSITIPEGVTSIGSNAFQGCTGLTSITIPKSVTSIGSLVFRNCTSLAELNVEEGNAVYHSAGNCIIETGSKTLIVGCKTSQIPADASVTAIGANAFRDCVGLTSIVIPDSVTSIGVNVFSGCSDLESITVPFVGKSKKDASDTYQYPFGYLFGSSSYTGGVATQQYYYGSSTDTATSSTYYIPASLKSVTVTGGNILRGAFYNCAGLTSITLPESVNNIGNYAFYGCSGLTSFAFPEGVTGIGNYAFSGCSGLISFVIPDSVTSIGSNVLAGCSGLESITIPFVGNSRKDASDTYQYPFGYLFGSSSYTGGVATQQYYYASNTDTTTGSTYYIPASLKSVTVTGGNILYGAFYNCSGLISVTLPEDLTNIGVCAFRGCTGLTSITIPDSVTTIGDSAFSGCSSLTCLTISDSVTSVGSSAFRYCPIQKLIVAEGSKTVSSTMVVGENTLQEVVIPEGVTSIDDSAFSSCKSLTTVTLPEGVTDIGNYAFSSCSSLTSVTIPNSVKSIGNSAFIYCSSLTSATIPEGITEIAESLFSGCSNLTSVTIPKSVTTIGDSAFQSCIRLASVDIPESVTTISYGAFQNCDGLTTVVIPEGVTSIESRTFNDCTNLATIAIPESVTSVGYNAFNYCGKLTDVFYSGKKNAILIDNGNIPLTSAKWHYEVIRLSLGDQLTFLCPECNLRYYCDATIVPLDRIAIAKAPDKLFYRVNEPVLVDGLDGISVQGVYSDGVTIPLGVDTIEAIAADLSAPGKKEVLITAKGFTASFEVYVHNVEKSTTGTTVTNVDPALYPSSSHDYANNQDYTKTFSYPGALSLQITFSTSTKMYLSDYIYIYDGNGNELGKYTGTQAAGLTLTIPGDTFKVRLVSNHSYTAYGYSFSSILAETEEVFIHPAVISAATATCTQPGLTEGSHCEICGQVLVAQQAVDALGHSYTEEITASATCTEAGSKLFSCSRCPADTPGHSYTEEISALGHTEVVDDAVAPTCTSTGLTEGKHCSVCNEILVAQEVVDTLDHTEADAVEENRKEPTCMVEGSYDVVVYCSVCNKELSREKTAITSPGHTEVIDDAVAPTCTSTGLTEGKHCSVCNEILVAQEVVDTLDHTEADPVEENRKEPTCMVEGSYDVVVYCSVCNKELSREKTAITSPGHTEVIDAAVAPTCTSTGLTEGKHCSVCNEILVAQEVITALDHTEADPVEENRKEPTCMVEGSYDVVVYCSVCSKELSREVAAITSPGHTEVIDDAVAPTCSSTGLTEGKHCSVCNEILVAQEVVASLDHTYAQGVCTVCGKKDPTYVAGVTISGSYVSFGSANETVTIQLFRGRAKEAAYTFTNADAPAASGNWSIKDVTPGSYTVRVTKLNHVAREYELIVGSDAIALDVEIWLTGDVTGDGLVNFSDYSKVLSQSKKPNSQILTDYAFLCGDVTGDGTINFADYSKVLSQAKGKGTLWQ